MVVLYIAIAIAVLLVLLLFIRVGALIHMGNEITVKLMIGPIRKDVSLKNDQPKKEKKKKKGEPKDGEPGKKKKSRKKKTKLKIGADEIESAILTLLPALRKTLRLTRRSIRLKPFNLHVTIGGSDPADVGRTYGYAEAAMWAVMPEAERLLVMPEPHLRLDCDFDGGETQVEGDLGISIQIGSIFAIIVEMLRPGIKWYRAVPRIPIEEKPEEKGEGSAAESNTEKTAPEQAFESEKRRIIQ